MNLIFATRSSKGGQYVVIFQKVSKNSIFDQLLTSTPLNVPPTHDVTPSRTPISHVPLPL